MEFDSANTKEPPLTLLKLKDVEHDNNLLLEKQKYILQSELESTKLIASSTHVYTDGKLTFASLKLKNIELENKILFEKQKYNLLQSELESTKLIASTHVNIYNSECMRLNEIILKLQNDYSSLKQKMKNQKAVKNLYKKIKNVEENVGSKHGNLERNDNEREKIYATENELGNRCAIVDVNNDCDDYVQPTSKFDSAIIKVKNESGSQMENSLLSESLPSIKVESQKRKEKSVEIAEVVSSKRENLKRNDNERGKNYAKENEVRNSCPIADINNDCDDYIQLGSKFDSAFIKVKNDARRQMENSLLSESLPSIEVESPKGKKKLVEIAEAVFSKHENLERNDNEREKNYAEENELRNRCPIVDTNNDCDDYVQPSSKFDCPFIKVKNDSRFPMENSLLSKSLPSIEVESLKGKENTVEIAEVVGSEHEKLGRNDNEREKNYAKENELKNKCLISDTNNDCDDSVQFGSKFVFIKVKNDSKSQMENSLFSKSLPSIEVDGPKGKEKPVEIAEEVSSKHEKLERNDNEREKLYAKENELRNRCPIVGINNDCDDHVQLSPEFDSAFIKVNNDSRSLMENSLLSESLPSIKVESPKGKEKSVEIEVISSSTVVEPNRELQYLRNTAKGSASKSTTDSTVVKSSSKKRERSEIAQRSQDKSDGSEEDQAELNDDKDGDMVNESDTGEEIKQSERENKNESKKEEENEAELNDDMENLTYSGEEPECENENESEKEEEKDVEIEDPTLLVNSMEVCTEPSTPTPGKEEPGKSNPSNKELRVTICDFLKKADFNNVTFTKTLNWLCTRYEIDLTPRKTCIKLMVQEELGKLADEIESSEEEMDHSPRAKKSKA